MSNIEIGRELFLSVDTVKTYVRRLYAKLGVRNRAQAALCAAGYNVLPPEARTANRQGASNRVRPEAASRPTTWCSPTVITAPAQGQIAPGRSSAGTRQPCR